MSLKKNKIKIIIKNSLTVKTASVFLAALILSTFVPIVNAQGTAQFNTASGDQPGLQVSNYTKYPGSNSNWARTVSADPGDVLSFLIFYHNTSSVTAYNTRLKLNLSPNVSNGNVLTSTISADNAYSNGGSVNVYLNYGSNLPLTLVTGSARWYTGSSSSLRTIPFGQSGDEVVTAFSGLRIGDIGPGNSGYVVVRAQLGGYTQSNPTPQGDVPSVFTNSSSNISTTSATLQGSVNPNNSGTTAWFEYGPTQSLGFTTSTFAIGGGTSQTSFSGTAFSLSPNTTYYYKAVAQNSYGTARGSILSFTTQANQIEQNQGGAPVARTEAMSGISTTSATLLGSINPNGASTEGWFEYGTTQSLGSSTSRQNVGSGSGFNNFNFTLTSLSQNTTYYYRAMAQNNFGTSQGTILSFMTQSQQVSGGAPLVNTNSASVISTSSATLYGSANPNNSFTTGWFEYGTSGSLGNTTSSFTLGSSNSYQNYYATIFNLSSNTTYYYRAVAQNGYGTAYGSLLTLTTGTSQVTTNQDLSGLSNSLSQLTLALARLNGLVGGLGTNRVTERVIERVEVASSAGSDLAKLTFTADKESLDPGDKIVFTVKIEPFINLTNAILAVKLDPGFEFESTSANSYSKSENTFVYNLGSVTTGSVQTFTINARLKSDFKADDAEDGKITSAATFSYADANGNVKTPLFSSLDVKIGGTGFFAGIFAAIPGGATVTILLIALLILLVVIAIRKLLS